MNHPDDPDFREWVLRPPVQVKPREPLPKTYPLLPGYMDRPHYVEVRFSDGRCCEDCHEQSVQFMARPPFVPNVGHWVGLCSFCWSYRHAEHHRRESHRLYGYDLGNTSPDPLPLGTDWKAVQVERWRRYGADLRKKGDRMMFWPMPPAWVLDYAPDLIG